MKNPGRRDPEGDSFFAMQTKRNAEERESLYADRMKGRNTSCKERQRGKHERKKRLLYNPEKELVKASTA